MDAVQAGLPATQPRTETIAPAAAERLTAAEVLVRCLRAEGVEVVFAIADISYGPVLRAAQGAGIRIVGGRNESAEVHMADAWARVTGTPAVAMAGMGPGVVNLLPAGRFPLILAATRDARLSRHVHGGRHLSLGME